MTYGRGLKQFVLNELDKRVLDEDKRLFMIESEIEGKLVFKTDLELDRLVRLRTVERLFVLNLFKKDVSDRQVVFDTIQSELKFDGVDDDSFTTLLDNWNRHNSAQVKKQCGSIKYRVDCKLTGKWRSKSTELRGELVQKISNRIDSTSPRFQVDLVEPDFIITCHLTDTCLIVGLPVTPNTLSLRDYLTHVGLRSTICSSMIQLVSPHIQNQLVLDPFCGQSTIQREFAQLLKDSQRSASFFLCSDASQSQLEMSCNNMTSISHFAPALFKLSPSLEFPFRGKSFDVIISDIPFNMKHPVVDFVDAKQFYAKLIVEFDRLIVDEEGVIVLLLSRQGSIVFVESLNELKQQSLTRLTLVSEHAVSLGETTGTVVKLKS